MAQEEIYQLISAIAAESIYILVEWPFVQELMEHDWFQKECLLYNAGENQQYLVCAYFVPAIRLAELQISTN